MYRREPGPSDERVTWIQGDVTDAFSLDPLLEGVDTVIHAAGLVSFRMMDKSRLFRVNEAGTRHVVDACLHWGVRHLLYTGSTAALGYRPQLGTYDEDTIWVKNPWTTPYAESKYRGELEVWRGREEGLGVSVFLPAMTIYPGDGAGFLDAWAATGSRYYPPGGHSFVDGRDVAHFIRQCAEQGPIGERVILAGADLTYRDLLGILAAQQGRPAPDSEASWLTALLTAFRHHLNDQPALTLSELRMAFRTLYVSAQRSREKYGVAYRPIGDRLEEVCQ